MVGVSINKLLQLFSQVFLYLYPLWIVFGAVGDILIGKAFYRRCGTLWPGRDGCMVEVDNGIIQRKLGFIHQGLVTLSPERYAVKTMAV